MSEKEFTVDDILKQLKEDLSTQSTPQPPVGEQKAEPALTADTSSVQETALSGKLSEASQSPQASDARVSASMEEGALNDGNTASEELEKHEQMEEQRLRELMLSTAHLKYISLRKNREKTVQGFKLRQGFTMTQPIERHKIQEEAQKQQDLKNAVPQQEQAPKKMPDFRLYKTEPLKTQTEKKSAPEKKWEPEKEREQESRVRDDRISRNAPFFKDTQLKETSAGLGLEDSADNIGEFTSIKQTDRMMSRLKGIKSHLTLRAAALAVLTLISFGIVLLNQSAGGGGISLVNRLTHPMSYCVVNLILLLAAVGIGYDMFFDGFTVLFRKGLGKYTLYSFGMIGTLLTNLILLVQPEAVNQESVSLYVPLAVLCTMGAMVGRLLGMERTVTNFKFVSGDEDQYAADIMANQQMAEDFTKGALEAYPELVYNKKTPFLSRFIENSFCDDPTDHQAHFLVPIFGGVALAVAVLSVVLGNTPFVALTAFSGILLVGVGLVPFFYVQFPLFNSAKSLSKLGGVVLGYDAVDDFSEVNAVMLNANEIFYGKDVTLYGIKTFSNAVIDRVILDATAVLCASKSILGEVFLNIISNRKDYLDEIDGVLYEDGMGISAWVDNRRVLIGSRELMINHNVSVPGKDYEEKFLANNRHLVYLANGGELSAVFVIGLECSADIRNMITGLYNNDVVCIVKTVDPILTRTALAQVFDMPERTFRVIPSRLHKEAAELSRTDFPANAAVSNNGSLRSYIYSVLLAKRLNKNIHLGNLINYLAAGLAILLFIGFTALGGLGQLSVGTLCLYELICLAIALVVQKFYKL